VAFGQGLNSSSQVQPLQDIDIEQNLDGKISGDLVFRDESGKTVKLADYLGDKPVVLTPVYYNCPGLCTPIMDGLVKLMNRTDLRMGKDFQVINISFHEEESQELAALKKKNYGSLLRDKKAGENWHFLTGDKENIAVLLETLGYSLIRHGEDILHPAAIMIVSPAGKIVKYIHGTKYNPIEFKMAVAEAEDEKTMPTITKVLKMCFNYEPAGRGKQKQLTILGFITMLCISLVLIFVYPPLKNKR
jgi:protein SCO1/2